MDKRTEFFRCVEKARIVGVAPLKQVALKMPKACEAELQMHETCITNVLQQTVLKNTTYAFEHVDGFVGDVDKCWTTRAGFDQCIMRFQEGEKGQYGGVDKGHV